MKNHSPNLGAPSSPRDPVAYGGYQSTRRVRKVVFFAGSALLSTLVGLALVYFPPLLVFGAVGGLIGTFIILRWPYAGLLFYTVLFILRPGELYPVLSALRLERIVGVVTLASLFLATYRMEKRVVIDQSSQTRWLGFFVLSVILSIPMSYWPGYSTERFIEVLKIVAFYIMTIHLIDTQRRFRTFVWVLLGLTAFLAVSSLRDYYTGNFTVAQGIQRAGGSTSAGGDPNSFGTTMASAFPLFFMLALFETVIWRRVLALGGFGLSLWSLALTGSRASVLGFLAGLVYLWTRSRHKVVLGVVGSALVVGGFVILPDQYKTRYGSITSEERDESSRARIEAWKAGMRMMSDRPLFGVGIGCFGVAYGTAYSGVWLQPHSLYVQVPAELGLVGTVAFFGFMAQFLLLNRRVTRNLRGRSEWRFEWITLEAVFAGFVILLVSAVFGHSLMRQTWYVYAALGLAVHRIWVRESSREKEDSLAAPKTGVEG